MATFPVTYDQASMNLVQPNLLPIPRGQAEDDAEEDQAQCCSPLQWVVTCVCATHDALPIEAMAPCTSPCSDGFTKLLFLSTGIDTSRLFHQVALPRPAEYT